MEGEVSNTVKLLKTRSFQDSDSNWILDQPITLTEVKYVAKNTNTSERLDGTVGKLIKYGGKTLCEMLTCTIKFSLE